MVAQSVSSSGQNSVLNGRSFSCQVFVRLDLHLGRRACLRILTERAREFQLHFSFSSLLFPPGSHLHVRLRAEEEKEQERATSV